MKQIWIKMLALWQDIQDIKTRLTALEHKESK